MWTREYIKTRAKEVLKLNYWKAILISIVLYFVGGDSRGGSFNWRSNHRYPNNSLNYMDQPEFYSDVFVSVAVIILIVIIAFMLFRILIGYALEVGGRRFFKQAAQTDINMSYLGYAFKRERYKDVVVTMLYKGVLNLLWSFLLIVPGIVKGYAYSMVPYILADNPNIGYKRAVELSNQMTDNQKWDMFVLDLSFIGWYLLCALLSFIGQWLFFIGTFFVRPYENATKAELYLILRQNALENGYCTPEELLMESPI
jgi:uncharacterized membrane protein